MKFLTIFLIIICLLFTACIHKENNSQIICGNIKHGVHENNSYLNVTYEGGICIISEENHTHVHSFECSDWSKKSHIIFKVIDPIEDFSGTFDTKPCKIIYSRKVSK